MITEHDRVVLTSDIPEEGLVSGDVGTIIHIYQGGEAFEVEFITLSGKTVAVVTVSAEQVRPVRPEEITHAREIKPVAA